MALYLSLFLVKVWFAFRFYSSIFFRFYSSIYNLSYTFKHFLVWLQSSKNLRLNRKSSCVNDQALYLADTSPAKKLKPKAMEKWLL